jgi:hypothetical protein
VQPGEPGAAAHLHPLAGCDRGSMPDDGDQVALTTCLHPQHAKAAVGVVERHALDQTGQRLNGWATVSCGRRGRGGTGQFGLLRPCDLAQTQPIRNAFPFAR